MPAPSETTPSRWRQGRWVAPAFEVVLGLVALGALLTGLLTGLDAFLDDQVDTPVAIESGGIDVEAIDGFRLDPSQATLTIEDPDSVQRLAVAVPTILGALAVGIVATLVLEVVRSLRQGDPFTPGNARVLAQAAVVSVIGGVVVALADVGSDAILRADLPDQLPVAFSAELSSASLFAGLVFAALAQVFHHGARLTVDTDG